eukprot:Nk52_evm58s2309 gene=Nk52_evmTU58s2309
MWDKLELYTFTQLLECLKIPPESRTEKQNNLIVFELIQYDNFSKLSTDVLVDYSHCIQLQRLPKDQTLFRQGDPGDRWYFILAGSVSIYVLDENAASEEGMICVCTLGTGEAFGELALIEDGTRNGTVKTNEGSYLLYIDKADFLVLYRKQQMSLHNRGSFYNQNSTSAEHEPMEDVDFHEEDEMLAHDTSLSEYESKDYLLIPPEERTEEIIEGIFAEISHFSAFTQLESSVKHELCSVFRHQKIPKNTVVFNQGDEGTTWFVIVKGTVSVIVNNITVAHLSEGHGFGEMALETDRPRAAAIATEDEDCEFIVVEKDDYLRLLKNLETNTVKLEENGKVVMVLERRSVISDSSSEPVVSVVEMRGTVDKLIEYLIRDDHSPTYVEDFIFTVRTYVDPMDFWSKIYTILENSNDSGVDLETQAKNEIQQRKDALKVIEFTTIWLQMHPVDFIPPSDHSGCLDELILILEKIVSEATYQEFMCVMDAYTRSMQKHIGIMNEQSSAPKKKVSKSKFGGLNIFKKFKRKDSSSVANINKEEDTGDTLFSENAVDINMLDAHIKADFGEGLVLELDPHDIAEQLTLMDSRLFRAIDPISFICFLFKRVYDVSTDPLERFIDRFNQINFWVVTEIVSTKNISKRVNVIKFFIKAAQRCHKLNNFNSLFAIVSGLSNMSVSRLTQTWERLSPKHQEVFKILEGLLDPSRNMKKYRTMLAKASPPLIPFFPLFTKDLTFIHEGNDSKIDGLINFDKLRMLSREIRCLREYMMTPYTQNDLPRCIVEQPEPWSNYYSYVKSVNAYPDGSSACKCACYLESFPLISDQDQLMKMSNEIQPRKTRNPSLV